MSFLNLKDMWSLPRCTCLRRKKKQKTTSRTHQNTTIDFRMEHLSWTAQLTQESTPKKGEVADTRNTSRVNHKFPTGKLVSQWHMLKYLWIKRPGHSISLIIRKMQIRATVMDYVIPTWMAMIIDKDDDSNHNKGKQQELPRMWRNWNVKWCSHVEHSLAVLKKLYVNYLETQ